jgi:hypothetical protein
MRRMLVDAARLVRERSGSSYRVGPGAASAGEAIDPARVLAQMGDERAARKRGHAG